MLEEKSKKLNIHKKPWIQPILDHFKTIKKYNDIIEKIRDKLCLSKNFSPNQLFDFLDFQKNGFLTSKNIIYFLNQTNEKYKEQYIRHLIHNYDKDGDFTLNKKEFYNLIFPTKNKNIKEKILSTKNTINENEESNNNFNISNDIKYIFNELIKEELKLGEDSFFAIKNIYNSPKFTTYGAFMDIVKNESYITRRNLNIFLRENEFELEDDDIYLLMFRIDKDNDNMSSYVEFQDIFYPLKNLEKYNDNSIINSLYNNNINLDLNKNDFNKNNNIDNNIYSTYYNYDYYSGYKTKNKDLNYNDYLIKNNYLRNNYYLKDNYKANNTNKYSQIRNYDYRIYISQMNENLKNIKIDNMNNNYKNNNIKNDFIYYDYYNYNKIDIKENNKENKVFIEYKDNQKKQEKSVTKKNKDINDNKDIKDDKDIDDNKEDFNDNKDVKDNENNENIENNEINDNIDKIEITENSNKIDDNNDKNDNKDTNVNNDNDNNENKDININIDNNANNDNIDINDNHDNKDINENKDNNREINENNTEKYKENNNRNNNENNYENINDNNNDNDDNNNYNKNENMNDNNNDNDDNKNDNKNENINDNSNDNNNDNLKIKKEIITENIKVNTNIDLEKDNKNEYKNEDNKNNKTIDNNNKDNINIENNNKDNRNIDMNTIKDNNNNDNNNNNIDNEFSLKNNDKVNNIENNSKDNIHKDEDNKEKEKDINKDNNNLEEKNIIKDSNNNKKEEKSETLSEEIVIKDSEEKKRQGFTNSINEKKYENNKKIEKNENKTNNITFQSQNCFKFAILGNNNSNSNQELKLKNININKNVIPNKENKYLIRNNIPKKENKYLIKNNIPKKENKNLILIKNNNLKKENKNNYLIKNNVPNKDSKYDYISATERILNRSRSLYQNEKNNEKEESNLNTEPINNKTKNFTDRKNIEDIIKNRLNIYNNFEDIINNSYINNEKENNIYYNDNINEDIKSYTTPKINRNLPSFYNVNNYQNIQTPIIINNNKNIIINKSASPKTNNKLITKNDVLFELLNDYIIQDTKTENILENLSLCPDFNLINLFQSFLQNDYLNKNKVAAVELYQTLTNMGLNINMDDILYLYLKFNKKLNQNNDPGFTYDEFCKMVTPKNYSMAKNLINKENKKYFLLFSIKTQRIICSLFKQFIDGEKSNENLRQTIIGNENNMYKIYYCVENLFNSLRKDNKDGIDENDIFEFMKNNGRKLCKFEVELLMDRFDKNKDELIDFAEFYNEIKPKL